MRVLILSCNTGGGHNACGKALLEMFQEKGVVCQIQDAFSFISPNVSHFISNGFTTVYRYFPDMFRKGYQYTEDHPDVFKRDSPIYHFLISGTEPLYHFILKECVDTVICTHVFSALMVTEVMRQHNQFLHTYFVATDYTCSPSCNQSNLDTYFIPDASLSDEFIQQGIPTKRLISSGIPIRKEFYRFLENSVSKRKFNIPSNVPHLLMMCGSMGCGPIKETVVEIAKSIKGNYRITVVCGTNNSLYIQLSNISAKYPNIRVYGFVENISELMDSTDLFLTKPGGISITEAASKKIPMVFINAVAGCEEHNMNFYMQRGVAVTANTPKGLARLVKTILSNKALLEKMKDNYKNFPDNMASEIITEYIMQSNCLPKKLKENIGR